MALTDGHKALAGIEVPQPVMVQQAHQEKEEGNQQPVMAQQAHQEKEQGKQQPVMAGREREQGKQQPVMAGREKEQGKQQPVMAGREKGKGKASDGSEAASSSDRAYICAWERREHKGPSPCAPPNPDRYIARDPRTPATQKARDS